MKRIKFIRRNKWSQSYSLYKCDCGKEFITRDSDIKIGKTKSCGCYFKKKLKDSPNALKHGHRKNRNFSLTYSSWSNMISRCTNPNYTNFKYWGGKGIKVCQKWLKFENFLKDMGERPFGTSLDRIDGTKDYYKENCRWATRLQQNQNRILIYNKNKLI